jgi:hypothetical protein
MTINAQHLEDFAKAINENDLNFIQSLLANRVVDVNARLPRAGELNPSALLLAARLGHADVAQVTTSTIRTNRLATLRQ